MHPIEGKWQLDDGELDGFENLCLPGTHLILLDGKLKVKSESGACYSHSFEIDDTEDPPELHCKEGDVTDSIWSYSVGNAVLELVYVDAGEPGFPTWAGFPPTSSSVRKAVFHRIN